MLSTNTRPMPVFMIGDDTVTAIAHELDTSLREDINNRCHGLLGHNKHRVELYILPEGYALNVTRWQRKQCKETQLRHDLFDPPISPRRNNS